MKQETLNQQERFAKINEANRQEERLTAAFLEGKISLEEFHQSMEKTHPLTKVDLRKLAS
ncbi:hypothetical protein KJ570_01730 [Patescibacteria group bacterium]|nr:hypothetical protein [Patescibacteria group bacterium]MBU2036144.1 hypothetical protein [Patescibacteria group bacterium]